MRVLHVIPSIGPLRGGPSLVMGVMARALRDAGVEVDVATTNDNDTQLLNVPIGVPVNENGVRYWYFERSAHPYTTSAGLARWLRGNIRNYDVVHAHALFSFSTSVCTALARKSRVPYIVRPLGTLARYGMAQHALLKQLSWLLFEKNVLLKAAAVHFTSDAEREEAERLGRWRSLVVPLGVEPPAVSAAPSAAPLTFLFLARIHPKKRVELLLEAFAEVGKAHPDVRLLIAGGGEGAYLSQLRELASRLRIADAVSWPGHVSGAAKVALFEQSHVFVLPSINENFGIAAVEALGAGLPVVVTRGVAIHREVTDNHAGMLVEDTAASLADGMKQLADEGLRTIMGGNATRLAREKFSIEAMQRGLLAMYQQVLAA